MQVSTKAWYAALERAGIQDFRGHGLRRTWGELARAERHTATREPWGLGSPETVRRYAHFSAEYLAPYADRLFALRLVAESANGTNLSQAANLAAAS